jgi:hypothetical protein
MTSRTVIAVAVVGALLVGGAVTGTTFALWRDGAPTGASTVKGGAISLTVDGSTTVSWASPGELMLNSGSTPGTARSTSALLRNGSTGKNLRMQMHLDAVTASAPVLTNGLEVAATTVAKTATCPSPAATFKALSSYTTTALTATGVAPGVERKLCVDVRVKGGAPDVAGQSGTLTFTLRGQQVRP